MITSSIVTYNTSLQDIETIIKCASNSCISKIWIIDNSPTDVLKVIVQPLSGKIEYIFNNKNIGYGAAHNIAIQKSIAIKSTYHIVLNADIIFDFKVIDNLKQYMNTNPSIGQIMPKVLYPNGDIQHLCKLLPTPTNLIFRRFIPFGSIKRKMNIKYEMINSGYDKTIEAPSLSGCFMFIRTSVLDTVNGFDDNFFMYLEDVDLCRRIGEVSKTIFYPNCTIIHNYEKSSYKNKKLLWYHIVSAFKYFNKWGWFFDKKRELINNSAQSQY